MITEYLPLLLFALLFILILFGYPVAFTLGGLSILVGLLLFDVDFFYLLTIPSNQRKILQQLTIPVHLRITIMRSID